MALSVKGLLYRIFIDPLIHGLRHRVAAMIAENERVIDVACGTGALSMRMAARAVKVTGIDLSEDMIVTARRLAGRKPELQVSFEMIDETDLSVFGENQFDTAVSTLAMHQFDPDTGLKVLGEMKRVATRLIIADYNCPMRPGPAKWLSVAIERAAAGDHYRNFRQYMARGGLEKLASDAGLQITSREARGEGVFMVTVMKVDK